jgi:hypothetical protein
MAVEIREIRLGENLGPFLDVVDFVYRSDPNYVRSLDFDLKERLSPKNPFFEHAEGTVFTAYRNGVCVGRVTAQIDHEHLAKHADNTGFFGFLDTINDQEVASALLASARTWLRNRGMKRIRGPLSLSTNEEVGCLVEGFDTPPMMMMPHHRRYQGELIEGAGLARAKTLYAWRYEVGALKPRVAKALEEVSAMSEVSIREVRRSQFEADTRTIMEIFNDAWSDNWGHVAATPSELKKIARDLWLVANPELALIASINGEPAAVAVAVPNINEVIADFNGKLLPLGLPKLLYRLKVQQPKTARLWFLGIRKQYRNNRRYAGLSAALYAKLNAAGKRLGIQWGELSWTDEDNGPVNAAIKMMGGTIYKKYAVYEAEL